MDVTQHKSNQWANFFLEVVLDMVKVRLAA